MSIKIDQKIKRPNYRQPIAEKRAAIEAKEKPDGAPALASVTTLTPAAPAAEADGAFPASATLCKVCHTKALVVLDGCETCLNCGASKCG